LAEHETRPGTVADCVRGDQPDVTSIYVLGLNLSANHRGIVVRARIARQSLMIRVSCGNAISGRSSGSKLRSSSRSSSAVRVPPRTSAAYAITMTGLPFAE